MTISKYKPQKAALTHFNGRPIVGPPSEKKPDRFITIGGKKFRVIPVNITESTASSPEEAYLRSLRCYMK